MGEAATKGSDRVSSIMAEISAKVKAEMASNKDKPAAFRGFAADQNARANRRAGELRESEQLRFLNENYDYPLKALDPSTIKTHREGIVGRVIVSVKRAILRVSKLFAAKHYANLERDYQAHLIRFLNDLSQYVDARDASNFWELIRKLDFDITKAFERIERINDDHNAVLASTQRAVDESLGTATRSMQQMNNTIGELRAKLSEVDSSVAGLEAIMNRLPKGDPTSSAHGQTTYPDFSYLMLENRFRGNEENLTEHLKIYPTFFQGLDNVLEIGSGRGELQSLLRSAGIKSYGVDVDAAMVEAARAKGHVIVEGDALAHLRELQPNSLGGLIAIQVVEHLSPTQLQELINLAASRVKKGGRVIFETINPKSLQALSSNYFRDITHKMPLHPDTLDYIMKLAGMKTIEVRMLSPIPEGALLQEVPLGEQLTPRWMHAMTLMNQNIRQLNNMLYGYQDFCIVAEVTCG